MKFKLVEELLLERKWYRVDFKVRDERGVEQDRSCYMNLDDNETDARNKGHYFLYKIASKGDDANKQIYDNFISKQNAKKFKPYCSGYINNSIKLTEIQNEAEIYANRAACPILTDLVREFRTTAREVVAHEEPFVSGLKAKNLSVDDVYIHHLDHEEHNNSPSNLSCIVTHGDNTFGKKINAAIHDLDWYPDVDDGVIYAEILVPIKDGDSLNLKTFTLSIK